jgi:N-hydroxyarylamine O-acetyltransferase
MLGRMDLQPVLRRIGLGTLPPPDLDGLRALHRAYVGAVPYEALAAQLGESGPLDEGALAARVAGGAGGYCFELNTVLFALIREAGFTVERREAHVNGSALCNHMALVVTVGAERYLADAGLGEGPLDPVLLRDGHVTPGPLPWRVERTDGGWRLTEHEHGSITDVVFGDAAADLDAFAPHHRRLSTQPDSPFVQTLVVQRPYDDRIVTLRSRTLSADAPGVRDRRVVEDEAEFAAVLAGEFGLGLDTARNARLWERAVRQHEAFTATGRTA